MHAREKTKSIDLWSVARIGGRWVVVDCNGLEVADCGDRSADAELIVEAVNAYPDLMSTLTKTIPYVESLYENLADFGLALEPARRTLDTARRLVARLCGDPRPREDVF